MNWTEVEFLGEVLLILWKAPSRLLFPKGMAEVHISARNATVQCRTHVIGGEYGHTLATISDSRLLLRKIEKKATVKPVEESTRTLDPAMIGVLVGMALMFVIICVVLRLFSRARWRENRTIFNTPNPRLMNVSLLRDSKLLHSQGLGVDPELVVDTPQRPYDRQLSDPRPPQDQHQSPSKFAHQRCKGKVTISKMLSMIRMMI
ncbi:hypothetical protein SFRURICE_006898 [Spodoptera frugiperda]|nr:hypothetical protein SFRURICE_006898 [Spodoptera frugiperda]